MEFEQGWELEGKITGHWGTRQPHRTDARGIGRGAARRLVNVPSSMLIRRD